MSTAIWTVLGLVCSIVFFFWCRRAVRQDKIDDAKSHAANERQFLYIAAQGAAARLKLREINAAKDREKRLTRYRCAILIGYASNEVAMVQAHEDFADHKQWPDFNAWQAAHVEILAHAMLAAEKAVTS